MLTPYIIGIGMDLAAFAADRLGSDAAAGTILIAEAVILGIYFYQKDRCLVSFRLLLSVFWIGGEGLAAWKLSRLHTDWTLMTWLCFSLFYLVWLLGYDLVCCRNSRREAEGRGSSKKRDSGRTAGRRIFGYRLRKRNETELSVYLLRSIVIMTAVPWAAFLFEAVYLGFIPLFSVEPHAYSYFHVSGVHYFTVSSVFVPALSVIYLMRTRGGQAGAVQAAAAGRDKKTLILVAVCCAAALLLPILCVSKFFFAFSIVLPVILFLLMGPKIPTKLLAAGLCAVAVLFAAAVVFMTASRHYQPGYLDSVFEMKDSSMPVMLQYVYMYIANNYANFNELTMAIAEGSVPHLWGLKELFPVFALTGLKFRFPELTVFYQPVTKDILNTLTLIYDAFYDFGLAGVIVFGLVLGSVCEVINALVQKNRHPMAGLVYAQIALYLMLSFFSAWFSVATTWFWLALTGILCLYTSFSVSRD